MEFVEINEYLGRYLLHYDWISVGIRIVWNSGSFEIIINIICGKYTLDERVGFKQ